MRILTVICGYPPEKTAGPQQQAACLTQAMWEKGHVTTVLTLGHHENKSNNRAALDNFPIVRIPPVSHMGTLSLRMRMLQKNLETPADIVHIHEYRSSLAEVAARIARIRGIPYVLTAHGTITGCYFASNSFFNEIPYRAYDAVTRMNVPKKSKIVIATSFSEAQQIIQLGVRKEIVKVIPHGIDPPDFLDDIKVKGDKQQSSPRLLFVGRISPGRNIPMLLRAFKIVQKRFSRAVLVLCGDFIPEAQITSPSKYRRFIRKLIISLGLQNSIVFKGWLKGTELWTEYLTSDVFVWPSVYDNFAYPLLEAAISGLPIITTPVGIGPDLIGSSEGGLLVPHGDYCTLAECIIKILNDKELQAKMGSFLQSVSKKYTAKGMVRSHEKLYKRLLNP